MGKEWHGFLTEEEIEEVERIKVWMEDAIWTKMMEDGGEDSSFVQDMVFPCICLCKGRKNPETWGYGDVLEKIVDPDARRLLAVVCKSSRRHGLCQCPYHQAPRKAARKWDGERDRGDGCSLGSSVDEGLPF